MDYYHALYLRIKDLEGDPNQSQETEADGPQHKLTNALVRSLQSDFVWHGFAHALSIYFPYELCQRLNSYPNIRRLCLEYLKFCDADSRMATRVQIHTRFEQFVLWKEVGVGRLSETLKNQFEVATLAELDAERYQDAAQYGQEVMGYGRRAILDNELVKLNRYTMTALTGSNLAAAKAKMKLQAVSVYYRLNVAGSKVSAWFISRLIEM